MSSNLQESRHRTARPAARRRDGIALAATGAIPQRVRSQILAEHHAELTVRARARVVARIDVGLYPLPIPYGFRHVGPYPSDVPADTTSPRALLDLSVLAEDSTVDGRRVGRAPALHWGIDRDCAHIVRTMSLRLQYDGITPAKVARILNLDRDHPPLLTVSGRPQRWTGRAIRTLLTDPVLIGYSVWGRTHHGRPRPRHAWTVSSRVTHPPILDTATFARMVEILLDAPATTETLAVCAARPQWQR